MILCPFLSWANVCNENYIITSPNWNLIWFHQCSYIYNYSQVHEGNNYIHAFLMKSLFFLFGFSLLYITPPYASFFFFWHRVSCSPGCFATGNFWSSWFCFLSVGIIGGAIVSPLFSAENKTRGFVHASILHTQKSNSVCGYLHLHRFLGISRSHCR